MDRIVNAGKMLRLSFPRERGDGPNNWSLCSVLHRRFPRERGDGPFARLRMALGRKFSPRARGWTAK